MSYNQKWDKILRLVKNASIIVTNTISLSPLQQEGIQFVATLIIYLRIGVCSQLENLKVGR